MTSRCSLAKILKLSCTVCVVYTIAAPSQASAVTKRTAHIYVQDNSGRDIEFITVNHKYSDNYKYSESWLNLPNGVRTKAPLVAEYHTGAFTTGKDWWRISWKFKGDRGYYITNPNNFRRAVDARDSIGTDVLKAAGSAIGPYAGKVAGGPGVGTTVGALAGGATGGNAGAAAVRNLSEALMNGDSTVGFKQHILRSEDDSADRPTVIEIKATGVTFHSPSGASDAVYIKIGDLPEPPNSHLVIRTGTFAGLWHGDNAQFTIDKLSADGTFNGSTRLLSGVSKGYVITFTGKLAEGNVGNAPGSERRLNVGVAWPANRRGSGGTRPGPGSPPPSSY